MEQPGIHLQVSRISFLRVDMVPCFKIYKHIYFISKLIRNATAVDGLNFTAQVNIRSVNFLFTDLKQDVFVSTALESAIMDVHNIQEGKDLNYVVDVNLMGQN